jgi:hypothetical protein
MAVPGLPWRGPGPGRPDLPLPPGKVPLRRNGVWRKRWRYVGAFSDELLMCAARVHVGPVGQTFWAVWDREQRTLHERTRLLLPTARGEVWTEHPDEEVGQIDWAPDEGGTLVRIEAEPKPDSEKLRAFLRVGEGAWAESICPTGEDDGYVWTRKRISPVECDVRIGDERRIKAKARAIEDESCGYHPHHTVWSWSAGVGEATDGRTVGWNLVSGVNDPPESSERAIWIDGQPTEPGAVEFDGLEAVAFPGGERLEFSGECERQKEEKRAFISYSYRQPFGTFTGTLPGGIELRRAFGVMEFHEAHW